VCLLCLTLGTEERIERSIGADRVQIALLRADLRGWLDAHSVDPTCRDAVLLACSEAVANAIEHGYRDDPFGVIDVTATVTADSVEVRVGDHGTWQGPLADVSRGRGLQIIRQSMDQVMFDRSDGTTVTMRRKREGA
jgi:serine/threonine-protein kinase RsbW